MKNQNQESFAKLVEKLREITGVSFVSTIYTNKQGEKSTYLFNVTQSLENQKKKDLEFLMGAEYKTSPKFDEDTFNQAKEEMIKSLKMSLGIFDKTMTEKEIQTFKNRSKGQTSAYDNLGNGLKVHHDDKKVFVYGLKVNKKVISNGEVKADTRKPKTIAKDSLRSQMKSTKYRQFEIENADSFSLKGEKLEFV